MSNPSEPEPLEVTLVRYPDGTLMRGPMPLSKGYLMAYPSTRAAEVQAEMSGSTCEPYTLVPSAVRAREQARLLRADDAAHWAKNLLELMDQQDVAEIVVGRLRMKDIAKLAREE